MNPYDASDVLPPKPDEPVEPGQPFYVRPLPRWFVIGFFGSLLFGLILIVVAIPVIEYVYKDWWREIAREHRR